MKPYVVGIAGGSASGKTSFLKHLLRSFTPSEVCLISQDNYYIPIEQQNKDENGQYNFDLPTSIDRKAFHADLHALLAGGCFTRKEYTFNNPNVSPKLITYNPAPLIIMEGLFIFHYEEIKKLLDLRVFIDAREEIKLQRRLKRDSEERGYPAETVMYQWKNHVMPSFRQFLQPYRDEADIIITNNISYDKGLHVLVNHLKTII